jgi:hypothetical protein
MVRPGDVSSRAVDVMVRPIDTRGPRPAGTPGRRGPARYDGPARLVAALARAGESIGGSPAPPLPRGAMLDSTNPSQCIKYRIAFDAGARLLEASRFDHSYGRDFARRVEPDRIRAEVARLCSHHVPAELRELAVDDAIAGRRPRW